MHLAIVIFAVADVQRAVAFYDHAFGWSPVVSTPVYVELAIDGRMHLGLYERTGFARNIDRTPPPAVPGEVSRTELYFRVESLAAAVASLERAGATCLSPAQVRPWGDEAAYFADPDGNVIVVASPSQPDRGLHG